MANESVVEQTPWLVTHLSKILVSLVVIAAAAGTIAIGLYAFNFGGSFSEEKSAWAEFGDYVGGTLNATFAFLALIALALTLRVQSIELKLSTEELRRSAKALDEQNKSLATQTFENTFFQLIRLHNDIVSSLDLRSAGQVTIQGRDCFSVFRKRLMNEMLKLRRGDYHPDEDEGFHTCYEEFWKQNEQNLGHYFRHLYRIYKFLDESDITNKNSYSGIVRAQLSSSELTLLHYNGISKYGEKFKPLIEQYAILKNMSDLGLIGLPQDRDTYSKNAYGK
ncbi:hypothetical protein GLA29479_3598 [Lysobacter antibioticus]|uniref:putative phage abortive infection protein n=1 Tax=Lysobacter antibioticus TaxID=84531 RepID=UPI00072281E9|nr:putative phage abortive infection protein [Lysobacter antibioticus]ALN64451.1 hypothetical protein GLA29479_3598 [Lysobacter antibioticus]